MNRLTAFVAGALAMYMLDPQRGARRRAMVGDKLTKLRNKSMDAINARTRDLQNRAQGVSSELQGRLNEGPVSDEQLIERVRAELGHVNAHAGAIGVMAQDGRVTLRGPVLAQDVAPTLQAVMQIRGVKAVDNQMDVHETAENIPGLQGQGKHPR